MEGIGYDRIDILNKVQKLIGVIVKDFYESNRLSNEDILEHIKYFDWRNRTYGMPIQEADALKDQEIGE